MTELQIYRDTYLQDITGNVFYVREAFSHRMDDLGWRGTGLLVWGYLAHSNLPTCLVRVRVLHNYELM